MVALKFLRLIQVGTGILLARWQSEIAGWFALDSGLEDL